VKNQRVCSSENAIVIVIDESGIDRVTFVNGNGKSSAYFDVCAAACDARLLGE
jgi:hypothetical protein